MMLRLQRAGRGARVLERLLGLLTRRPLALEGTFERRAVATLCLERLPRGLGRLALAGGELAGLVQLRAENSELPGLLLETSQQGARRQVGVDLSPIPAFEAP